MPLAYSIHLQSCVWLYLFSIPFQIIGDVGPWWTIPITGIAGICFLGILAIGFEIENPFGYDANDLVGQRASK
jgi:putative membrane protein